MTPWLYVISFSFAVFLGNRSKVRVFRRLPTRPRRRIGWKFKRWNCEKEEGRDWTLLPPLPFIPAPLSGSFRAHFWRFGNGRTSIALYHPEVCLRLIPVSAMVTNLFIGALTATREPIKKRCWLPSWKTFNRYSIRTWITSFMLVFLGIMSIPNHFFPPNSAIVHRQFHRRTLSTRPSKTLALHPPPTIKLGTP